MDVVYVNVTLLVKAAAQFDEEKSFILGIELPHICMYMVRNIMYIYLYIHATRKNIAAKNNSVFEACSHKYDMK